MSYFYILLLTKGINRLFYKPTMYSFEQRYYLPLWVLKIKIIVSNAILQEL